jgi:hypothetical protein
MKPLRRPLAMTPQGQYNMMRNHGRVLAQQVSFGATTSNKEFDRNIQCSKATGTTPGVAGTQFAVNHNLGRIPVTFFGDTTAGVLNRGGTAWTKTQIFLTCTAATAAFVIVII